MKSIVEPDFLNSEPYSVSEPTAFLVTSLSYKHFSNDKKTVKKTILMIRFADGIDTIVERSFEDFSLKLKQMLTQKLLARDRTSNNVNRQENTTR